MGNTKHNQTAEAPSISPRRRVRRKVQICKHYAPSLNAHAPMHQIWNVVGSNGRNLCECKTESAAKLIKTALDAYSPKAAK